MKAPVMRGDSGDCTSRSAWAAVLAIGDIDIEDNAISDTASSVLTIATIRPLIPKVKSPA
jgi:hypothetical protein